MLSLPVIKEFIKARHPRKQRGQVDQAFFPAPDGAPLSDIKALLLHLAAHLDLDLLALIELDRDGKSARLTAAGSGGLTCDLALPSLENGGRLAGLIDEAIPACGSAKIFTRDEVFPHDGTWCDFIPMDSTVAYAFVPIGRLPVVFETWSSCTDTGSKLFALATSESRQGDDSHLTLRVVVCASLISLSMGGPWSRSGMRLTDPLRDFLERERYSFCTLRRDGMVSDTTGDVFEEYESDTLLALIGNIEALAGLGDAEIQGPYNVTPESVEGTNILAYPIAWPNGRQDRRVILKRSGIAPAKEARTERFTMLSRFMSSIAHEIKNPLTGIAAGVQYLSKKLESGSTEDETVEFVLTEINRLNRIVDDLYRIAKPPELCIGTSSINDIVGKSLLCLSEDILKKRLSIEQHLDKDVPEFDADSDRLQQVLINIIKNAVEASSENATIRVKTTRDGSNVVVRVSDSGLGIPEEDAERIFEPFYSTKKGGTGLGLCISQRIVDQHGGRILIESSRDGGTTFVIELPLGK